MIFIYTRISRFTLFECDRRGALKPTIIAHYKKETLAFLLKPDRNFAKMKLFVPVIIENVNDSMNHLRSKGKKKRYYLHRDN